LIKSISQHAFVIVLFGSLRLKHVLGQPTNAFAVGVLRKTGTINYKLARA